MTEQMLMAVRIHDGEPEAEPVVAEVEDGRLRLVLDDGDVVDLDVGEITAILGNAA